VSKPLMADSLILASPVQSTDGQLTSGAGSKHRKPVAGEFPVGTFPSRHGKDERVEGAGNFRAASVGPIAVGCSETHSSNASLRPDQNI